MANLYSELVSWFQAHMLTCPSKKFLHLECPGCGFQRSVLALMKGNLFESVSLYPASMPIFACLLFLLLHLKFDFSYGARVIKYFQVFIGIIIAVFYIYKVITLKVFN